MSINIMRDGGALAITPRTSSDEEAIRKALEYTKIDFIYEFGQCFPKASNIICWAKRGSKIVFALGYLDKIRALLKARGHKKINLVDLRPHSRPQVFVPDWSQLEAVDLRFRQRDLLELVANEWRARIDCPPGYGKTFCLRQIAGVFREAKIDAVVQSVGLATDMYKILAGQLPSVGICCGSKKKLGRRVMIYTAGSLHHSPFDADIVIGDEIHELATDTIMGKLAKYKHAKLFGLSASHNKRLDKADFELEGVFGPIRLTVTDEESREHGIVVPIRNFWHSVPCNPNPAEGLTGHERMKYGVWRNDCRNDIIAAVPDRYEPDEQILIIVQTLDHAMELLKRLPNYKLCYAPGDKNDRRAKRAYRRLGLEFTRMTPDYAQEMKEQFADQQLRKVIATGVWSRGVDFKPLRVLIRADASASPIRDDQIPGRTSRVHEASGKEFGDVHDFLDEFDENLRDRAVGRRRNYKGHGWEQIRVTPITNSKRRKGTW